MGSLGRITASAERPGIWPIVVIEAGRSINGNVYPSAVLREAADRGIFEGVTVSAYAKIDADGNTIEDHVAEKHIGRAVLNAVGKTRNTRWSESAQAVVGNLVLSIGIREADEYEATLQAHANNGNLDIPGLSIDAYADTDGNGVVTRFEACHELTIVTHPSAGGRFETHRIAASVNGVKTVFEKILKQLRESLPGVVGAYLGPDSESALERHIARRIVESSDAREKAIAALVAGKDKHPKLAQAIGDPTKRLVEGADLLAVLDDAAALIAMARDELGGEEAPAEEEPVEEAVEQPEAEKVEEAQPESEAPAEPVAPEPVAETTDDDDDKAKEDAEYLAKRADEERARESTDNIRQACSEAKLSDTVADALITQNQGSYVSKDDAQKLAATQQALIDGAIRESKEDKVTVIRESQERLTESLAHLFNPKDCPAPAEGAYDHNSFVRFVEEHALGNKARVSECFSGQTTRRSLREAVDSTNFDQVFADALSRSLHGAYVGHVSYDDWRKIVNVVPYSDFRTHRIVNVGYYGSLPTVAKAGTYSALTTPTDREETIALAKKGGLESIAFEDMLNDDLTLWQTMIQRLGQAAMETRYETVFALIRDATQPTLSDAKTLTDSTRSPANEGTAALTADATGKTNFITSITGMMKGTGGSGKKKGVRPAFCIIPFEKLEAYAYCVNELSGGNTGTDVPGAIANVLKAVVPEAIIDLGTSSTTDWYLMANPAEAEVIRFAELGGRSGPEIFVADDGRFGDMFTKDEIDLKVRDIHAAAAVDHLGIYGNDSLT